MKKLNVEQMENLQGGLLSRAFLCLVGQMASSSAYNAATNTITNLDQYGVGIQMQEAYC